LRRCCDGTLCSSCAVALLLVSGRLHVRVDGRPWWLSGARVRLSDTSAMRRLAGCMPVPSHTRERPLSYERRYRRKDRGIVWAQVCTSVIPDETGKPALFAAVVVDMTERKRADEALLRCPGRARTRHTRFDGRRVDRHDRVRHVKMSIVTTLG
jgi:hypothetical protein